MGNPVDSVYVDGSAVSKSDVRGMNDDRIRFRVSDANEIRSTDYSGKFGGLYKADTQTNFDLDPSDTTTEDDGVTCIIDSAGNRFKIVSAVPAPTEVSLGGVFSHPPVTHEFLTGIDTDGTPLAAQPTKTDVGLSNVDNTSDATKNSASATLTNKTIDASDNSLSNLDTTMFAADVIDADGSLAANSDTRLATQKAVKSYVASYIAAQDVEVLKGSIDCSANPNYPAADAGHVYRVSVAGKVGGASGPNVEIGDRLECFVDSSASGDHATVGANWIVSQVNIDGAVVGQTSSVDGEMALFSGTSGRQIKRAAFSGLVKMTSGIPAAATAGSDYYGPGSTDVAVADGGTGSSTASGARSNLSAAAKSQTDEFISGYIKTPAEKDYRLVVKIPHGGVITETVTRSESGTCTATFKINTTALGGTANSVSSTENVQAQATSNTFAVDDDIVLTISGNSSCAGLSFTIKYTRTLV